MDKEKIFELDSQGSRIMEYSLDADKWDEVPTFGPLTVEIIMGKQEWNGMRFEKQGDGSYVALMEIIYSHRVTILEVALNKWLLVVFVGLGDVWL